MNKLKEKKAPPAPKSNKRQNKFVRPFVTLFSGSFLSNEETIRQLPFIFFLAFLGLLYIGNGYYAERTVRRISKVSFELKELQSEFIISSSELMQLSKQSEVARLARPYGIHQSTIPPGKIVEPHPDGK
ncbi:MAG: hypothetical protein IT233_02080 [Bacteroidia bacterium]|nr:hypothetical protein [Bacteroidia bacterium]